MRKARDSRTVTFKGVPQEGRSQNSNFRRKSDVPAARFSDHERKKPRGTLPGGAPHVGELEDDEKSNFTEGRLSGASSWLPSNSLLLDDDRLEASPASGEGDTRTSPESLAALVTETVNRVLKQQVGQRNKFVRDDHTAELSGPRHTGSEKENPRNAASPKAQRGTASVTAVTETP